MTERDDPSIQCKRCAEFVSVDHVRVSGRFRELRCPRCLCTTDVDDAAIDLTRSPAVRQSRSQSQETPAPR